ncbi:MAG: RNA 2',3'-cyclic phosphodiesterase [Betaproteobacteria bacterium]|nr:RNA 2',3'-cyclic phosphodiesterase [Betaproteobacteria bacterium]
MSLSSPSSAAPGKRLFVALWPPPSLQQALAALVEGERGGVHVPAANVHMTLLFLGASSEAQEACYRAALRKLSFAPFSFGVDTFGWWRKPRVVWAGPSETPPELAALARQVKEILGVFSPPASHETVAAEPGDTPFAAHITLLRKHPGPAPAWGGRAALLWKAESVALVESLRVPGGVRYRPLLRIPGSP